MIKRVCMIAVIWISFVSASAPSADEVSYRDIASSPGKYLNKAVTLKGAFLFAEPMRESFTLDQNGSQIESFYADLPERDKAFLLSQKQYSKTEVTVSGILKQYTNSKSYFVNALSLQYESTGVQLPSTVRAVTYGEILADPAKYLKKTITMKGTFLYADRMRQSMSFDQGGNTIEVLIGDLSKIDRELLLSQKKGVMVIVTGDLLPYVNSPGKYYIAASSVVLNR